MNEQPPKIYLLPNLMTAGNLFCGFAAALKILQGALLQVSNPDVASDLFHTAIWFILGAFVFIYLQDFVMSVVPYWRLVFGAILAALVIFAPGGLLGLFARRRPIEVA